MHESSCCALLLSGQSLGFAPPDGSAPPLPGAGLQSGSGDVFYPQCVQPGVELGVDYGLMTMPGGVDMGDFHNISGDASALQPSGDTSGCIAPAQMDMTAGFDS